MKYIGHLDIAKTWERILRRAQIALSYSQGFVARPRMQLASPLPLGVTSECEILDVLLDEPVPLEGLAEHLMAVSPPGLPIYSIREVPLKAPALQTLTESAVYQVTIERIEPAALRAKAAALMAQPHILRKRRDKTYDLRPLLLDIQVDDAGRLILELASTPHGTGRPDEVIDALGLSDADFAIHRIAIRLREPKEGEIGNEPPPDETADADVADEEDTS